VDTHLAKARRAAALRFTLGVVAPTVAPASTHDTDANAALLAQPAELGVTGRLGVVMVDRGMTHTRPRAAARAHGLRVRVTGWPE
jgi:hypothetical protein